MIEKIPQQTNLSTNNLFVIEIKLDKIHKEFSAFLSELSEKIDRGIECLVTQKNFSITNPVMIVSHEYLYGYDHSNEGMTGDELNEFESCLQSKTNEIAKNYSIDIALFPGTIILKGDRPSNRAYFFTPGEEIKYTDKSNEKGKLFDWNGKKVFTSICCNWSNFIYYRPEADIYFIPSSGYFFLSDKASAPYVGSAHVVSNKPGIIFINSEEMFVDLSGVYRVKESATGKTFSLCKEAEHLKFLDKQDSKVFFDRIKISEVQIGPSLLKEEQKLDFPKGIQFFDNKKQREDEPLIKQENITEQNSSQELEKDDSSTNIKFFERNDNKFAQSNQERESKGCVIL